MEKHSTDCPDRRCQLRSSVSAYKRKFPIHFLLFRFRRHYSGAKCRCKTRLDGLNIIITGANSGIGKALAYELAERGTLTKNTKSALITRTFSYVFAGATLILACRNVKAALDTKIEIINSRKARSTGQIHIKHLDLNSIESILKFSDAIKTEFGDIYALVNNAGVFHHPRELTVDKFDVTIQTNYLGPFILTHLLLPNLRSSEHARIVNVSSNAHYLATEHDLKALLQCQTQDRSHILSYAASKLAVVLFSKQLNKNLSSEHNKKTIFYTKST